MHCSFDILHLWRQHMCGNRSWHTYAMHPALPLGNGCDRSGIKAMWSKVARLVRNGKSSQPFKAWYIFLHKKTYFISKLVSFIFNASCLILRLLEGSNEKHCKMIKLGFQNLKRSLLEETLSKLSTMPYSLSYPHSARSFIMDPLDLLFDFLDRLIG
jgi:hypothetical protein